MSNSNITNTNGEVINPDFIYMIIPSEYVCTYHKLLVLMSDFGLEMLEDCNAGCKGRSKNIVNCWNMFQTACAAYQLGNVKQSKVIVDYIKETINSIYGGTGVEQVGDIILPISQNGEVKAIIKCGTNPTFRPDKPSGEGSGGNCDCADVVQDKGTSTEDVMSQAAVTKELNLLKGDIISNHLNIDVTLTDTIVEKDINKTITLTWNTTYKGEEIIPDTISIKANNTVISSTILNKSVQYIVNNTTEFVVEVSYNGFTKTKIVSVGAYYPMYFKAINKTLISISDINNLPASDKIIKDSPKGKITVNFATEAYLWLIIPQDMTINKVIANGYSVPMNDEILISSPSNKNYKCYRSINKFNANVFTAIIV